ncbi:MAG: sterol desaturase family protein [Acaryochloridaceae cyanobacterium RU_4_10]|nr:sterol desaturase family protein [Acaryochloridaceae cyanobacterium RU_4_10]
MIAHSFWFYWISFFGLILGRYFLIAGSTHLFFYSLWRESFAKREVQLSVPLWLSIQRDIKLSILSAIVFAVGSALIMSAYDLGKTRLYGNIYEYGLWYLGVSYVAILLLQDAYFYFTHRLLHHRYVFRWLHQGHHRSLQTTPWTSFAFDLPEAIVQSLFLMGIVFILPIHFVTLIAVLVSMTIWATIDHLDIDLLPTSFPHHWFGKWFIGPAHHSIHHHKYSKHYGLYFTFWDKMLGTQDSNYDCKVETKIC